MIHEQNSNAFCVEDISNIENYEQAINDKTQTWDCHHRAEILPCGRFSVDDLKKFGLYFNRPASELIFLQRAEHIRIHNTGRQVSNDTKQKISFTRKERIASGEIVVDTSACHTQEANAKISEKATERYKDQTRHPMFGRQLSDETKKMISEANSGRILTDEHKRKISEGVKSAMTDEVKAKISAASKGNTHVRGKHWKCKPRTTPPWNKGRKMSEEHKAHLHRPKSEEHRKNIGLSRKGLSWFNDGKTNRLFRKGEEPIGWIKGMLVK